MLIVQLKQKKKKVVGPSCNNVLKNNKLQIFFSNNIIPLCVSGKTNTKSDCTVIKNRPQPVCTVCI